VGYGVKAPSILKFSANLKSSFTSGETVFGSSDMISDLLSGCTHFEFRL
jgi:hypothetical protein